MLVQAVPARGCPNPILGARIEPRPLGPVTPTNDWCDVSSGHPTLEIQPLPVCSAVGRAMPKVVAVAPSRCAPGAGRALCRSIRTMRGHSGMGRRSRRDIPLQDQRAAGLREAAHAMVAERRVEGSTEGKSSFRRQRQPATPHESQWMSQVASTGTVGSRGSGSPT